VAHIDWEQLHRQAARELRESEDLLALLPATRPPEQGWEGATVAWLIPVISAIERLLHRRYLRTATKRSVFPLAPRMLLGITPTRLVVWRARRRWRLGPFLGYVTLDRILQAEAPTVGQGWRTIRLHLANEPAVSVKVPARYADKLAAVLSGEVGSNE
jgi:hypothetical protein